MECRSGVERLPRDPCPRCVSVDPGHQTMMCQGTLPFAGIAATGFYHSPPLRRMIAALKYDGVTAARTDIETYLRDVMKISPWSHESNLLIIPMPLSEKRTRERGFNQAAWIAKRLITVSKTTNDLRLTNTPVLIRHAGKIAQADLNHDSALRGANVRGQFRSVGRIDDPVLLVDDVVTTGSTAGEAARALIAAGAPRVYLFTLAVGK